MSVFNLLSYQGVRPVCFVLLTALLLSLALLPSTLRATPVFINELHYDNAGADVGEAIELAGLAGIDLQGWRLWFYNGSNGLSYGSLALSGAFADIMNGYGFQAFSFAGIQNGSPDGIALVDAANRVQQFISYEGAFTALAGVAANVLSEDIGAAESTLTPLGTSLQLTGSGTDFSDFQWMSATSSFGSINALQEFNPQGGVQASVAIVPTWVLLGLGLFSVACRRSGCQALGIVK